MVVRPSESSKVEVLGGPLDGFGHCVDLVSGGAEGRRG
jgi:hypothetical protein